MGRENPIFEKNKNVTKDELTMIAYKNIEKDKSNLQKMDDADYCYNTGTKELLTDCEYKENIIYDDLEEKFAASLLRDMYKELFAEELNNKVYLQGCPSLIYDSKEDVYYTRYQCGGTGGIKYKEVYDYKIEENNHYVYLSVEPGYPGEHEAQKYKITILKKDDNYYFKSSELIE